jgi:hypothetical protein
VSIDQHEGAPGVQRNGGPKHRTASQPLSWRATSSPKQLVQQPGDLPWDLHSHGRNVLLDEFTRVRNVVSLSPFSTMDASSGMLTWPIGWQCTNGSICHHSTSCWGSYGALPGGWPVF